MLLTLASSVNFGQSNFFRLVMMPPKSVVTLKKSSQKWPKKFEESQPLANSVSIWQNYVNWVIKSEGIKKGIKDILELSQTLLTDSTKKLEKDVMESVFIKNWQKVNISLMSAVRLWAYTLKFVLKALVKDYLIWT